MTPVAAQASTDNTNVGPQVPPGPGADAAEQLYMAHQLYLTGVRTEDALLVIAAARIVAANPTKSGTGPQPSTEGGAAEVATSNDPLPDLAAMIATARTLAGDNRQLGALIDDVQNRPARGVITGPVTSVVYRLGPASHNRFVERFRGGEVGIVVLEGDGSGFLNLIVRDEHGNLICRSTVYGDQQRCSFVPRWTGPFQIYVENVGRGTSRYRVLTN
jgi:hypothetical protein